MNPVRMDSVLKMRYGFSAKDELWVLCGKCAMDSVWKMRNGFGADGAEDAHGTCHKRKKVKQPDFEIEINKAKQPNLPIK